jgi:hypothetical protein
MQHRSTIHPLRWGSYTLGNIFTTAWLPSGIGAGILHARISTLGFGQQFRFSHLGERQFVSRRADGARLIHASVNALAWWWASSKLPRQVNIPFGGQLFLPGEQGFAQGYTLLSFGTTQTCPFLPVTYPPSAVMAGVSMNLGPVVRLDCGEGQTKAQIGPDPRKALLIPCSEQTAP